MIDYRAVIQQQLDRMEAELATFVENANRQIAAQQGAIEVLRQLLAVEGTPVVEEAEKPDAAAQE